MENKPNTIKAASSAAWYRKDKNGKNMLSIKVTLPDGSVVEDLLFSNDYKKDKQPDYRSAQAKPQGQQVAPLKPVKDDDKIPF